MREGVRCSPRARGVLPTRGLECTCWSLLGVWWRVSARAVYQLTLCELRAEAALDTPHVTRVFAPHTTQRGGGGRLDGTVHCGETTERRKEISYILLKHVPVYPGLERPTCIVHMSVHGL